MISDKTISVVIPFHNEEGNAAKLLEQLVAVSRNEKITSQIIAVDDGSTDGTGAELAGCAAAYSNIQVLSLKTNFGQTAAIAAGIDHASEDILVLMDGDGQNDPADIPALLKKMDEGFDVVSGWRQKRKDRLLSRKLPSWVANALISWVTGVHLHDYGCTLKAYKRALFSNLQIAGEMHRFLPAWCVWQGGRVAEIVVQHHPRIRGKSKYGMMRIFKVLIDLATLKFFHGYLFKPNYLFSGSAFVLFAVGFFSALAAVVDKVGPDMFPPFRIPLLLLSGFSFVIAIFLGLMGLLAELLVRVYFGSMKQKPYRLKHE